MKKKYILEIETLNNIDKLYPCYNWNFEDNEEFVEFIMASIIPKKTKKYGYKIKVTPYKSEKKDK